MLNVRWMRRGGRQHSKNLTKLEWKGARLYGDDRCSDNEILVGGWFMRLVV